MSVQVSLPNRRLPEFRKAPREAVAAFLSGIGLIAGFLTHDLPIGNILYFGSMLSGGATAVPEATKALKQWRLDVHTLMIVAAIGAAIIGRTGEGAMLLFLFTLSGALEAYAMGKTKDAIRKLIGMRPSNARQINGKLIPIEVVKPGDQFLMYPGEAFPLDGIIVEGTSSIDQSIMTGESEPVNRTTGDRVVSGTLNLDGTLTVKATSTSSNSSLERVIKLVADAQAEKSLASSERLADRVGKYYAPIVLIGTAVWFSTVYLLNMGNLAYSAYKALTFLVAASPCALVISSPAAILSALAAAGRRGLLVRSGSVLEALAGIDTIAFDKTGTLTTGKPSVVSIWCDEYSADDLMAIAASVEKPAPHPLAQAIVKYADDKRIDIPVSKNHRIVPGMGITAEVGGSTVMVGRPEWILGKNNINVSVNQRINNARDLGLSVLVVKIDNIVGVITLEDTLRCDSEQTIYALKHLNVNKIVMLTGDHHNAAEAIRKRLSLSEIFADLTPEGKVESIKRLSQDGRSVAMIGDGVNDAPALAGSAVGITLGGIGSDVALDSSDVIVMEDRLSAIPEAISLARQARRIALQNVVISILGVVLLSITVILRNLPLPVAVLFHEGTTVFVVLNGLRLLHR